MTAYSGIIKIPHHFTHMKGIVELFWTAAITNSGFKTKNPLHPSSGEGGPITSDNIAYRSNLLLNL